ncbi:MAG: T9SS type A sorting domain-containing protein [Saprospiraceae bacterium]|nr:T9SS type A sorting domain-containing protein [Candidatus Vicinibacter affinis]MBP6174033.1 T9SS type A sorting domain-containing protein [Saprospiraceae bacterium]MBK6571351.1 T9SS type A sorting domain-containing protein [Candidatus Vicinibacter affinis]MBK6823282.1 T9SS type A sorting domain-containing protein [Candidatus Vicinibacter affinis]MBK7303594.1 T9SS type A sorting domain-containing protein [Candidatus Vicinibacter affinis]
MSNKYIGKLIDTCVRKTNNFTFNINNIEVPIPTTNYLSFLGEIPEDHQLKIYSSNGIEVYSGKVVEKTINTSNFPPGIYFLELSSSSKSIFNKVFISKVH